MLLGHAQTWFFLINFNIWNCPPKEILNQTTFIIIVAVIVHFPTSDFSQEVHSYAGGSSYLPQESREGGSNLFQSCQWGVCSYWQSLLSFASSTTENQHFPIGITHHMGVSTCFIPLHGLLCKCTCSLQQRWKSSLKCQRSFSIFSFCSIISPHLFILSVLNPFPFSVVRWTEVRE